MTTCYACGLSSAQECTVSVALHHTFQAIILGKFQSHDQFLCLANTLWHVNTYVDMERAFESLRPHPLLSSTGFGLTAVQDIGGNDIQKQEIKEAVELPLTHHELYRQIGIDPPRGVLLYGAPGTGKTMLAKAVAHHTTAAFIRVVGSEFVQKYLGEVKTEYQLELVSFHGDKRASKSLHLGILTCCTAIKWGSWFDVWPVPLTFNWGGREQALHAMRCLVSLCRWLRSWKQLLNTQLLDIAVFLAKNVL